MAVFEEAISYVLANEGVDSDDAADRGGRTRYGITRATAARHGLDVTKLTLGEAKSIYKRDYWMFDGVNDQRVATKMLDIVVNCGIFGGTKIIQRAFGVAPDGILGKMTLAAINSESTETALERLALRLADYYVDICLNDGSQMTFLKGWMRRCVRRPR